MTALDVPLLWTTVERHGDDVALLVRGELSSFTAPALDSLLSALVTSRETVVSIDLRDATILPPAGERVLERWGAVPGAEAGTYELRPPHLDWD